MNFVHLQTILSRRHSGKRKFYQNKGFPTVKGFTYLRTDMSHKEKDIGVDVNWTISAFSLDTLNIYARRYPSDSAERWREMGPLWGRMRSPLANQPIKMLYIQVII